MLKKFLMGIVLLIAIVVAVMVYTIDQSKQYLAQPLSLEQPELVTIRRGMRFPQVIALLEQKTDLAPSIYTKLIPKLQPKLTQFKAGTFELAAHMTLQQALETLVAAKDHQFTITFVEGSRFSEWRTQLEKAPYLTHTLASLSESDIAKKLNIDRDKLEGLFLAETYHYTAGMSDVELLTRAHRQLMALLDNAWQHREASLPLKKPYEALILASIVEKETGVADERQRVAGVFVNRLRKKMRLQTDPTVIYGMGESYKGNIRKRDLRNPTPYNTYTFAGLPPTPIAMVGKASLSAALQPEKHNYYYFVASGHGGHVFSTTLSQHNRAVRAYLHNLRKQRATHK